MNIHYRVYKNTSLFPIISNMNPAYILTPIYLKIHFNIIISCAHFNIIISCAAKSLNVSVHSGYILLILAVVDGEFKIGLTIIKTMWIVDPSRDFYKELDAA